MNLRTVLHAALSCALSAAGAAQPGAVELQEAVRTYSADRQTLARAHDMAWSGARFERMEKLTTDWQQWMASTNFGALSQPGRIDYLLLRNELAGQLDQLALQRQRLKEMDDLLAFRGTIYELETARVRMQPLDAQSTAGKLTQLTEQVKKLKERVEKGKKSKDDKKTNDTARATAPKESKDKPEAAPLKVSATLARRTASAVSDLRGTLKNWHSFYDGYQPDFSWWLKKPYEEANTALESYAKHLKEEIAEQRGKDEDPLLGDPIGRPALLRDLAREMIPYTPEELIAIGEKEFAWCEEQMRRAAKEMGEDDWKKALARVKSDFVPPGQQDDLVAQLARESITFLRQNDLVTVPPLCEEAWRISMVSPEGQKTLPFAAYGGQSVMVAYAKDEMKHDDKMMSMRGNNRHYTRIVTAHELIPGHHLQAFMAARHREYRRLFYTPFLVEGWALYWELRYWDLDYARTPEDRIGMLFWRMHRCARIIVSLKFHLDQMQPKEMVDFLVDRVGHERFGATSEVRRFIEGSYSPLYQCGYMIGGLQLNALRKELVGPGKMSDRQFNDAVLTYGPIPVEMIRAGMLHLPLARETMSTWRFQDAR